MRSILLCVVLLISGAAHAQLIKYNKLFLKSYDYETNIEQLKKLSAQASITGKANQHVYYELLLGEYYEQNGKLPLAEETYLNALALAEKNRPASGNGILVKSTTPKTWFDPADQLAFFYLNTGNLRKAEELFQKSVTDRESFFPERSAHRLMPQVGLGAVYFSKRLYDQAYTFYTQALDKLWKTTTAGYDLDNIARVAYYDMVELNLQRGNIPEAKKLLEHLASAASGKRYSSKTLEQIETARVFELKARYYLALENYEAAQDALDKGFKFVEKSMLESPLKAQLLRTQALMQWMRNQLSGAADSFKAMTTAYHTYLQGNFTGLSEYEKEKLYYTLKEDFDLLNAFALHCHNQGVAESYGLYEVVLENQFKIKDLLLGDAAVLQNHVLNSGDNNLIQTYTTLQNNRSELAALYYQKDAQVRIDELNNRINTLEKQIQQAIPEASQQADVNWKTVQQNLSPDAVAAEMVRSRHFNKKVITKGNKKYTIPELSKEVSYLVIVVKPQPALLQAFVVADGNVLENRYAKLYRNLMLAQMPDEQSYQHFWQPIQEELSYAGKIYLAADGVFTQVNLNTLYNPTTKKYVLDESDLRSISSLKDLVHTNQSANSQHAVIFGSPSFSATPGHTNSGITLRSLVNEELQSLKEQEVQDLPGTATEVDAIETSLKTKGWKVDAFTGTEATERNIKSVRKPAVLHLATHGFFIADTTGTVSPMIRSGLLLAGVKGNTGTGADDGILTAYEAAMLNLQDTRLVILSACETGLGETRYGEGVYGLQRAVVSAGAQSLMMSLWKVDDTATTQLMTAFYQNWTGNNTAEAFQRAQENLRSVYPHPYHWGAFVLLGK